MFTEVSFRQLLDGPFAEAKARHGIEFDEYPNLVNWRDGDWLYEVDGFSVRVFRWPPHQNREVIINGPNSAETREEFAARFEKEFMVAVEGLLE